jgi:hypothetical protein
MSCNVTSTLTPTPQHSPRHRLVCCRSPIETCRHCCAGSRFTLAFDVMIHRLPLRRPHTLCQCGQHNVNWPPRRMPWCNCKYVVCLEPMHDASEQTRQRRAWGRSIALVDSADGLHLGQQFVFRIVFPGDNHRVVEIRAVVPCGHFMRCGRYHALCIWSGQVHCTKPRNDAVATSIDVPPAT